MANLNMMPEFTSEDSSRNPDVNPEQIVEEVKQPVVDTEQPSEPAQEEKGTPSEPPAEEEPARESREDTASLHQAIQGLQEERTKLLKEIVDLRGQKREIKQDQINKVQEKIEELGDVNPDDVAVVEKILRSKGYVTKEEQQKMYYDAVKNEELNKFLEKFPEYKPENDSNDLNWSLLQKELSWFTMPKDPHKIAEVLLRAHTSLKKSSERVSPDHQRKIDIAGTGSGGTQRSSSIAKKFDPDKRQHLLNGGWSEEEIKNLEKNL